QPPDIDDIEEDFTGLLWDAVPVNVIRRQFLALSQFIPEGWRYYLPAFMLHGLESDVSCLEYVVYSLYPGQAKYRERFLANVTGLSAAQGDAIRALLHLLADCPALDNADARRALEDYWSDPQATAARWAREEALTAAGNEAAAVAEADPPTLRSR